MEKPLFLLVFLILAVSLSVCTAQSKNKVLVNTVGANSGNFAFDQIVSDHKFDLADRMQIIDLFAVEIDRAV